MSAQFHLDLANCGSLNCNFLRLTTFFRDFINLNRFCFFQGQDFVSSLNCVFGSKFEMPMPWIEIDFDAKERTLVCSAEGCDFVSKDLDPFIEHVILHEPVIARPGTFNCPFEICKKSFTSMDTFVCHKSFHLHEIKALSAGWEAFVNYVNNDSPDVEWQLSCMGTRQYLFDFDDSPIICKWDKCKKTFLDFTDYAEHIEEHVQDGLQVYSLYICKWEGCNKEVNGTGNMKYHVNSHIKYKPYCCPGCGQFYAIHSNFKKHLLTTTAKEKNKYQCSRCGKSFPHHSLLREHFYRHVLAVTCDICGLMLHSSSNLEAHKARMHQTLMRHFPCPECKKLFKLEGDLKEHMVVHSGNYPHSCNQCGNKFKRKSELNKHLEMHQERKYICYFCPAEYKRSYMLSRHLKLFHSVKPDRGRGKFTFIRLEDEGVYGMQLDDIVFDTENQEE
ncbi:Histone H4 transcription factor [Trichinella murrelli]|uniref:Histone H4 transcription factor n=1 Tax=Trichinella murrelli TaxID=144512 RepID=A0A0V0U9W6_9BILA|nr:Histone H4 transcription factor [Trichinella murrelli]